MVDDIADGSLDGIDNSLSPQHNFADAVQAEEQSRAVRSVPSLFQFNHAPPEATGLGLDVYGRGAVVMSSLFVGPVLIQLAANEAESRCNNQENCEDARIYGMLPSSLLSNIAIVSGLTAAFLLPLFGAIVDHTCYRRQVGSISAALIAVIKGVEVVVSSRTWAFVAVCQVFSGVLYMIHLCATFAYTSELSSCPAEQTKYNTYFNILLYISTLAFLAEVLLISTTLGLADLGTARVSQIVTTSTAGLFFGYAWLFLFRNRPALSRVPEGSSLLRCGFRQIYDTTVKIRSDLPALKWFMVALTFNESASATLITIATTYMTLLLEMNSSEIGVVFLVVLILGIPGTKLGETVALRFDPVVSARACTVCFIFVTTAASLFLRGPEDKQFVHIFGGLWGLCLGWLHPMDSTVFITIIPKGQESELMGMYIFCGQVLSWLPPLVFTVLNEAGVEMSVGLASLNLFFLLGLCFLFLMGNHKTAVHVARLHSRQGYSMHNDNESKFHEGGMGDIFLPSIT